MSKPTVLVVDDDPSVVTVITDTLEEEGYRVVTGVQRQALQLARDEHPAVILLDVMMPGMDGTEMSRRLRTDRRTAGIPIIAISAAHTIEAVASAMQKDDYLAKPFDLEDLCAKVDLWTPPIYSRG